MGFKCHFSYMSDYNARMNGQLYLAISKLSVDDIAADRGLFFNSIIGTLNHLIVGDILWLTRFCLHSEGYVTLKSILDYPKPSALNDVLYDSLITLQPVRSELDSLIQDWIKTETCEDDFARDLTYKNSRGISSTRNFGELLSHLFNHQTHHRGQLTTVLNQLGIDVGVTDYLMDIPEK